MILPSLFLYISLALSDPGDDPPHSFDRDERIRPFEGHCAEHSGAFTITSKENRPYYFADCRTITAVTIDSTTISSLSKYLFYGSSISSLSFKSGLQFNSFTIDEGCFAHCDKLESITFPTLSTDATNPSITINAGAFFKCSLLHSITISDDVQYIGPSAFEGCGSLVPSFTLTRSNRLEIYSYAFSKCYTGSTEKSLELPKTNVAFYGDHAFENCNFKISNVQAGIIKSSAFLKCKFDSLTVDCSNIGENAFQGSGTLSTISKTNLVTIGAYAFTGLTINTQLIFTYSRIKDHAFFECKYTTKANKIELKTCYEIAQYSFSSKQSGFIGSIVLDCSTVGPHAFENFGSFSLTLKGSSSSYTIDEYAFYNSGIKGGLDFTNTRYNTIKSRAFANCAQLNGNLILDGVSIGSYAFEKCNFADIKILGQANIDDGAFENHGNNLKKIIIGEESTDYDNNNYPKITIGKRAFYKLQVANTLEIHSSVKSIGPYAFAKAHLPSNYDLQIFAEDIQPFAFSQCSPINKLEIYSETIKFHAFDETQINDLKIDFKDKKSGSPKIEMQAFYGLKIGVLQIEKEYEIEKSAFSFCQFGNLLQIYAHTIGPYSFSDCTSSPGCTLSIGKSLIEEYAFDNFQTINKLEFSEIGISDEPKIGSHAFHGSKILNYDGLTIPSWIDEVGEYAFANITDLKPSTLTISCPKLSKGAFYGCNQIVNFVLNENLNTIDEFAFCGTSLKGNLVIPPAVTKIGESAFQGLSDLGQITIFSDSKLSEIGPSAFQDSGISGELFIPNEIGTISARAFSGCKGLTSLAFYINSDGKLSTIDEYAFYNCKGLSCYLDIPISVNKIGKYAFANCVALKGHLTLKVDAEIGENAFEKCQNFKITAFEIIDYQQGKEYEISSSAFKGLNLDGKLKIPAPVKTIGESAFEGCERITTLSFEGEYTNDNGDTVSLNLQSIGSRAFYGCTSLTGILTIPSTVTEIKGSAFEGCSSLKGLVIDRGGNSLSISSYAFYKSGIEGSLIIPSRVSSVGSNAFQDLKNLKSLSIEATTPTSTSTLRIYGHAFCGSGISGLLEIPRQVTTIDDSAFQNCTGLTELIIGNEGQILRINNEVFAGTSVAGTLTITPRVSKIGKSAFEGCSDLTTLIIQPSTLTVQNDLTIDNKAFYNTGISESLEFPDRVIRIGDSAFQGLKNLKTLTLGNSQQLTIGKEAFRGCGLNGSLSINANEIGDFAFADNTDLTGPLLIGRGTFKEYVFQGCTKLGTKTDFIEDYDLDCSIKLTGGTLGAFNFKGCNNIKNTIFVAYDTEIGDDAFNGLNGTQFTLYLRDDEDDDKITIGERAFYWSGLKGPLVIPKTVDEVKRDAFSYCTRIGDSLTIEATNIGRRAFAYSTFANTLNLNIEETPSSGKPGDPGYVEAELSGFDDTTFFGCTGFKTLNITKLATIPDRLFYHMSFFEGVLKIPEDTTYIGSYAFAGCGFSQVIFDPDADGSVTIGEGAFSGLTNLTGAIELPSSPIGEGSY